MMAIFPDDTSGRAKRYIHMILSLDEQFTEQYFPHTIITGTSKLTLSHSRCILIWLFPRYTTCIIQLFCQPLHRFRVWKTPDSLLDIIPSSVYYVLYSSYRASRGGFTAARGSTLH